jgi:zinc transport system substrate-binding protein
MLKPLLPALFLASPLCAEVPDVVTDIAPVQGLVASVMGDLGAPSLLVPQGASPHDHALTPSEARSLQDADLVVWIGTELSPGIGRKIEAIAGGATALALFDAEVTAQLATRDSALFEHDHAEEEHDHDHAEDGHAHEEHAHDDHDHDHDDHDHDDHDHEGRSDAHHDEDDHAGDTHEHDHGGHDHGHDHGPEDAHAWLSPANARAWLGVIADALAEADPENAGIYRANAEAAQAEIDAAVTNAREKLDAIHDVRFVVFHDAYQYFEQSFGLNVLGAIQVSDATAPSPARLAELRDAIAETGATCVFAEPQFDSRLIDAVTEGTEVKVAELDPLGMGLEPGAGFYPALIGDLASRISDCAAD